MKKNTNFHLNKRLIGRVSVFIDAANLELSAKSEHWKVDYKKLYKWLNRESKKLIYIGFYTARFETKSHDDFLTVLKRQGYKLVTKKLKLIKQKSASHVRKANFDVEIAVDAIKKKRQFDTFVLFSGDSDFAYLVSELRKNGKRVIVVSLKYHIAKELVKSADFYLDLRKIKRLIQR